MQILANKDRDRIVSKMIAEKTAKIAELDAGVAKLRQEISQLEPESRQS